MNMAAAVRAVFNKYATFSGRARRAEYWWWTLALILTSIAVGIVDVTLFPEGMVPSSDLQSEGGDYEGPLSTILYLATLLPSLAVGVRRLHDVGKSGWWMFIVLVPLFGMLYLIYLNIRKGDEGSNLYGPDPLNAFAVSSSIAHSPQNEAPEATSPSKAVQPKRASWRAPSMGKDDFKSTQDRFKDK
ncbi:DUF805 domain-containing protein [Cohaesibacter celericrescens]|uniref:DUF805 domain-containing protein n=1 Tax=Cohaesibacter celericrescens TaxID=2067669 RepID=A0A2N5XV74_9HYPH|nr:DUF805 domain-containing protein [Cohaesibacter celericrescens]PLW78411.1 DUF805 domain-containing protein [Cohaesibacter celericrescens]